MAVLTRKELTIPKENPVHNVHSGRAEIDQLEMLSIELKRRTNPCTDHRRAATVMEEFYTQNEGIEYVDKDGKNRKK